MERSEVSEEIKPQVGDVFVHKNDLSEKLLILGVGQEKILYNDL